MVKQAEGNNGNHAAAESPYEAAVLGFRNYWYPVFSSREVGKKPRAMTLLGDPVVFMRGQRDGKVYAMLDECAHRGTQLSVGRGCEFPGTNTITCPYHGWTYDLETGVCVAVLPEGPESQVPGKLRIKTYPVEERKGIVWIWMGSMAPVPVEEDIPNVILHPDSAVKAVNRVKWGNWRWHAENVFAGHPHMVHRDSLRSWFAPGSGPQLPGPPEYVEDTDTKGIIGRQFPRRYDTSWRDRTVEFPGLGRWYKVPWYRRWFISWWVKPLDRPKDPIEGVERGMLFLPGVFKTGFGYPTRGDSYYEWYVPIDADHYIYFQITSFFARNPLYKLWRELKYYFWGKPTGVILFNNQDAMYVGQTTKFTKRHDIKIYPMSPLSRNDDFHTLWREHCDEYARGVGTAYRKQAQQKASGEPAIAGGSED